MTWVTLTTQITPLIHFAISELKVDNDWVTLSLVNTKDLNQSLTPNYRFNT